MFFQYSFFFSNFVWPRLSLENASSQPSFLDEKTGQNYLTLEKERMVLPTLFLLLKRKKWQSIFYLRKGKI
jgi:hypothetical protein